MTWLMLPIIVVGMARQHTFDVIAYFDVITIWSCLANYCEESFNKFLNPDSDLEHLRGVPSHVYAPNNYVKWTNLFSSYVHGQTNRPICPILALPPGSEGNNPFLLFLLMMYHFELRLLKCFQGSTTMRLP